jgi:hypothetical protein
MEHNRKGPAETASWQLEVLYLVVLSSRPLGSSTTVRTSGIYYILPFCCYAQQPRCGILALQVVLAPSYTIAS